MSKSSRFTAFDGMARLTDGSLAHVTQAIRSRLEACATASVLVFDQATGQQVDIDLRGATGQSVSDASPAGPGRPKLGVVGREVTLLPRHWEWLGSQPGGASVALRKLVENARRENAEKDNVRHRQEAAYKFMSAIAGNLAGYEEALRSLFANDQDGVLNHTQTWPGDVRDFAMTLAFPEQLEQSHQLETA